MNKTKLTQLFEYHVYDYFYLKRGLQCGLEVSIPMLGRADFVGIKNKEVTIVEIKTSLSDFRSKSGHNFIGHKNYYAMPLSLYEKVKADIPNFVGVLTFDTEDDLKFQRLYVKKNAKTVKHIYPSNFYDKLNNRIEVAKQSNIRRLLYQRYNLQNK